MKPEDAFHLIDAGAVKNRTVSLATSPDTRDDEASQEGDKAAVPGYFNHTLRFVSAAVTLAIIALLVAGGYLLSNRKTPESSASAPPVKPLLAFSDGEIHTLITGTLNRFLECSTTEQRLNFVVDPDSETTHLIDYYEVRRNRDSPLRAIRLIKPILLSDHNLWVVSYTDAENTSGSATFKRVGNRYLLNWSSSYAYGDLPWDVFATARPSEPVAMRAFLLHHHGDPPPGYPSLDWATYIIEDKTGDFTQLAVMRRAAEGQSLMEHSPPEARLPVNIELLYEEGPHGQPQLVIGRLIHFKWLGDSSTNKGTYSRRSIPENASHHIFGIDSLD